MMPKAMQTRRLKIAVLLSSPFVMVAAACFAQEQKPVAATGESASVATPNAQAAVDLVARLFTINPVASAALPGKPQFKNGVWGVRSPLPDELPKVCQDTGVTCTEVLYHSGEPAIVCAWTILFPAKGTPKVVWDNEASANYMMTRGNSEARKQKTRAIPELDFLGDTAPKVLKSVDPSSSPEPAGSRPTSGSVTLTVIVDTSGTVAGVFLTSGFDDAHNSAALRAARQYKFSPMLLDGRPQTCEVVLIINWQVD